MRRLFSLLLGLSLATPIQADELDGSWSIKALALYQNLEETGRSGSTLVEESGLEPAIELAGEWPAGSGSLIGSMLLSRYTLDYEGKSQAGRLVDSETDYQRVRMALGYSHPLQETLRLKVQLEVEWLERDINGVDNIAGLNEETQSNRLLIGLEKDVLTFDRQISVELTGVWGLSGTQEVSSPGIIDEVELPEGRTYGVRGIVSIPLNPDSKGGWTWTLTPTVEYLHSDRSEDRLWTQNGVIRGTLAQPETRRWAAGVGLMAIW
jgi:hypothetical protein